MPSLLRKGALADGGADRPDRGRGAGYPLSPEDLHVDDPLRAGIGLLAALDSGLGGYRARLQGEFHTGIFLSGILGNSIIAVALTWLGQKMGVPIYLAAIVVFGTRLFQNFGEIRRELLTSGRKRGKMEQDIEDAGV